MTEVKACVLRVGGTNCDIETNQALNEFEEVESEVIRLNQVGEGKDLFNYDFLVIPGGFSYGDHVRAGAVFASKIKSMLDDELKNYAERGGSILGICNGFQVLLEMGLLPGFDGVSEYPKAALAINESAKYECRWTYLKNENEEKCIFTEEVEKGEKLFIPVAHKEGRFIFPRDDEENLLEKLYENDQMVFRYCNKNGNYADGKYPQNPNGAFHDIAGICDPSGKIFGLMPHPERAYFGLHLPNWTMKKEVPKYADGRLIFESVVKYLKG